MSRGRKPICLASKAFVTYPIAMSRENGLAPSARAASDAVGSDGLMPRDQVNERSGGKRRLGRPTLSNEQLLDIALDLFLENGFEGTSLEAITSAAGMAKRTVYARYADKKTLFRAALRRAIDEWIVPVHRLKELETEELEETLLRIGRLLVANIMSPAGLRLFRLTNTVSGRMPDIAAENVRRGTEPTISYLADLFERRVDLSGDRMFDAEHAATAFIHLVAGGPSSMAAWGVLLEEDMIHRHTRSSVNLFLYGLLPRNRTSQGTDEQNRRLRRLLTDALLENMALKEEVGPPIVPLARTSTDAGRSGGLG
jgi:TetR/AcrR family transcriptional regulator, mexJK operon transcriptional repressor